MESLEEKIKTFAYLPDDWLPLNQSVSGKTVNCAERVARALRGIGGRPNAYPHDSGELLLCYTIDSHQIEIFIDSL